VPDGVRRDEPVYGFGVLASDEVELQTGGTGVHDQDVHAEGFS
jgi:hypothetical protein